MKVGEIYSYAYRYNACYPQFVRIIRTTAKSVWVEKLQKTWATNDGYGQNGTRVPNLTAPASPISGSFRIKTATYNGKPYEYFKIDGCVAMEWDGKPMDEYTD